MEIRQQLDKLMHQKQQRERDPEAAAGWDGISRQESSRQQTPTNPVENLCLCAVCAMCRFHHSPL